MESPQSICEFWFGTSADDAEVGEQHASLWWSKKPEVDAQIKARFGSYLPKVLGGELAAWQQSALGHLALILLVDQFPRNIFRGTAQSFAFDPVALSLCKQGIAAGVAQQLRPIQQVFFYMPLEHSEDFADQDFSVQLFEQLSQTKEPRLAAQMAFFTDFAHRHHAVIERFGRFPHRNEILGRPSTAEELAFLQTPGSAF
ncbi:MAG: DUF924 domain-containing protein [Acaryochloridaceae cyanobacterium SU_2_1]|nr:DUF924 domain-containing protein [Acaryochloridaceae cyanobacterium SU_2_1]